MTEANLEKAKSASGISSHARNSAEDGFNEMSNMSSAMESISEASNDISKIIKTIDEIAFQTNILALNAAVEAARAGESGQGFAVVADEVRNLAQRSAQAAQETEEKIKAAIQKSDAGVEIAEKVSERLNQILDKSRDVDSLVHEIATASKEQYQGIKQISNSISDMHGVTQSNSANANEIAQTSDALKAQAANLGEIVQGLMVLAGTKASRSKSQGKKSTDIRSETTAGPSRRLGSQTGAKLMVPDLEKVDEYSADNEFKDF